MLKKTEIYNIISQFFKINRFFVILGKVKKRIFSRNKISDKLAMINWLENNLTDISLFAKSIDSDLWDESLGISKEISNFAKSKLEFISHDLGGGGAYPFLYFLTRYLKPKVIVVEYLDLSLNKLEIKNLSIQNAMNSEIYKLIISKNYTLANMIHSDLVFIYNDFRD